MTSLHDIRVLEIDPAFVFRDFADGGEVGILGGKEVEVDIAVVVRALGVLFGGWKQWQVEVAELLGVTRARV